MLVLIFIIGILAGQIMLWTAGDVSQRLNFWKKGDITKKFKNKKISENVKDIRKIIKKSLNKQTLIIFIIGIVYCLIFNRFKISFDFIRYILIISLIIITGLIDYKTRYVNVKIVYSCYLILAFSILIELLIYHNVSLVKSQLDGGIIALIFSTILALTNGMGWGDVEIFFICGLLLGLNRLIGLIFLTLLLFMIHGTFLIIKNRKIKGVKVAFVPYITVALIIMSTVKIL